MASLDPRTNSLKGCIFASSAQEDIPETPAAGTSYRDPTYGAAAAAAGWPYYNVVNSADFNQMMFLMTSLLNEVERQGILPYCNLTDYPVGAICRYGTDESFYVCTVANGPTAPHNPSDTNYWKLVDFSNGRSWMNTDGSNAVVLPIVGGTVGVDLVIGTDYAVVPGSLLDGWKWYRKWASGWLEQGGFCSFVGNGVVSVINFGMNFVDTDYIVFMGNYACPRGDSTYMNKTTSSVWIAAGDTTALYQANQSWLAIGRWK